MWACCSSPDSAPTTPTDYYFLPADVDTGRLRRNAVPYYEIKKTIAGLPGKMLAFIDTCHSGNVLGGRCGSADLNALAAAQNGVVVFASSTGRQMSLEDPPGATAPSPRPWWRASGARPTTPAAAELPSTNSTCILSEQVKEFTGNRQTPATRKPDTIPDFLIAVVR